MAVLTEDNDMMDDELLTVMVCSLSTVLVFATRYSRDKDMVLQHCSFSMAKAPTKGALSVFETFGRCMTREA